MDFYTMTDKGIAQEIGSRIKSLRLRRNLTQEQVSTAAALSLNTIKTIESGKGKLSTIIAVLRELWMLEALDSFIPEATISPLHLAKQQGKKRQRASGSRIKSNTEKDTEW